MARRALRALLARGAPWLAALALSCASPWSASDDSEDLYSASARDYGFAFDGRTWELERRPLLSVVRTCNHPEASGTEQTFFTIGCKGELARQRGFEYIATLRSWPEPCALDPRNEDCVFVLGFTHEPGDVALPPELRAEIGPGSFQRLSEAATSVELARQRLGHWPAAEPSVGSARP